jgi:hypothetical protein
MHIPIEGKVIFLIAVSTVLLALTFPISSESAPQIVNMSHDLVSLGIASQNLTPNNPALDAVPLFQAAFQYVRNNSVQTLTLDKGAYYLLSNAQGNAVLIFQLSNVTIDLAGSTLYFKGPLVPNGIYLYYCSNVTVSNFQIDYMKPPYTHVALTSVDTTNRLLMYQTLAGWPDPSTFNGLTSPYGGPIQGYWGMIFRNGSIVPGTSRTLLQAPFTNNTIAIQDGAPWAQAATLSTLQAGDTVVVYARGGGPAIFVEFGSGITLSNIAVYGSQSVLLIQTTNTTVNGMRIEPRPGSGLIGGVGGINFVPLGANDHIRNSYVARTIDDAIGFNNPGPANIISQPGTRQLYISRFSSVHFPNGTPMDFVDRGTTLESTAGTIVDQQPPDDPNSFPTNVTLTFDRDLPTVASNTMLVFGSAATRGQGSTIEDNIIEDTYGGRGLWLSGVEGVTVQRNVIRRTSMAGIVLWSSTESVQDPGDDSPPSQNVLITDNVLEGSLGPAAAGSGLGTSLGAVQVAYTTDPYFVFGATASHSNITIQNNYIADSERSGLWIGELNGGTLSNNLIIRYSQNPTIGGLFGIPTEDQSLVTADASVPVAIHYSSSVVQTGNTSSATSNITAPVTMTASGPAITGSAGTGSFNVQPAVSGFAWNAASDSSWLSLTSAMPGSGAATVQYAVTTNSAGVARTGHITIAGEVFTVTQPPLKKRRGQLISPGKKRFRHN